MKPDPWYRQWGGRIWVRRRWKVWLDYNLGAVLLPKVGLARCGDGVELWAMVGAYGPDPLIRVTIKVPRP